MLRRPLESGLAALVAVNDRVRISWSAAIDGHAQRIRHRCSGRPGIDRPADNSAAGRVEYDSAVHLAVPCGVFDSFTFDVTTSSDLAVPCGVFDSFTFDVTTSSDLAVPCGVFDSFTFDVTTSSDLAVPCGVFDSFTFDVTTSSDLAVPCGVFGDVGDPQPIRFGLSELAVDEIRSGRELRYIPVSGTPRESLNACPVHQHSDRLAANADTAAEGQLRMYPFGPIGLA